MKKVDRIKSTIMSIRRSIKRFPVTIVISSILSILLIYLNESNLKGDSKDTLIKINLILGLGILLSLIIGLALERWKKNKRTNFVIYILGAILLGIFYFLFLNKLDEILAARYISTILSMFLIVLFIQRINKDEDYEYYLMDIFSEISLTIIYSIVLYIGISGILFTIDNLFDVNIRWELYLYMFIVVVFVFAVSLFLSKFPEEDRKYRDNYYTSALRVLLTYIVIPLISIYTAILYVYFGKILITREWPRGLVSHLVLWYSTVSVGVLFLISPILKTDKISNAFKKIFPKAILPILLMMFLSIGQRISQYGLTENRYYVVVLGIWVLLMMIYFSFMKKLKNIIIPISLSAILIFSVYGPLSSFSVSKYSQNKRFEKILMQNEMISSGKIISNGDISKDDKEEINNIISYFSRHHTLKDIKLFPEDIDIGDLENLMGFKYEPYNRYGYRDERYIFYGIERSNIPIEIKEYDYYVELSSWNEESLEIEGIGLNYNRYTNKLNLVLDDEKIEIDMVEYIQKVYDRQSEKDIDMNTKDRSIPIEAMSFERLIESKDKDIMLKFIFTNINGRLDLDDRVILEGTDFILLIDISDK